MMHGVGGLIVLGVYLLVPVAVLYLIVKLAVKHAITELKNENIL